MISAYICRNRRCRQSSASSIALFPSRIVKSCICITTAPQQWSQVVACVVCGTFVLNVFICSTPSSPSPFSHRQMRAPVKRIKYSALVVQTLYVAHIKHKRKRTRRNTTIKWQVFSCYRLSGRARFSFCQSIFVFCCCEIVLCWLFVISSQDSLDGANWTQCTARERVHVLCSNDLGTLCAHERSARLSAVAAAATVCLCFWHMCCCGVYARLCTISYDCVVLVGARRNA